MRYPNDMPSPSRKGDGGDGDEGSNRGRMVIAIVLAVLVVLALSLRAIATFWTDFLWFDQLDLASVWQRLLSAKVTLGVATTLVFFVLLWSNLVLADRLAPRFRPATGPEDEFLVRYRELVAGRQRMVWLVVSLVIAIIPGLSASAQWREWLLFRFGGSFGVDDPQFGTDIGFYVFRLPFLTTVTDWLFGFLLVTTIAVAILHYLNGAIRMQPLGERVTPNAKAHLSVLLAAAAFTKAVDYYLRRYELVVSGGSAFDGAGYTDVNASLPAIQLMILISAFAGVLLLVNIRRRGWALPVIILALWGIVAIIAGGIYPAFVQRFQVAPSELAQERPFIERNISATREALGMDAVGTSPFDYDPVLTPEMAEGSSGNIDNARLLDPTIVRPTFEDIEVEREYFTFRDVDVDRYEIDGTSTPVVVSSRELNLSGVTAPTWEKLHLVFTHGYAAALAPANDVNDRGEPLFLVEGIPARVTDLPPLERPEMYHGEGMTGYSIVGTKQTELSTDNVEAVYEGASGVQLSSVVRRAAFALRFGAIEPLISDSITDESKVIYKRDVTERVRELAPFLETDPDPYPILIDGRVQYLVDAYTTSPMYPYSQSVEAAEVDPGSTGSFNYLRNSVKALVDSYDGSVTLYLTDELYGDTDPIIAAWGKAFPGLFSSDIPDEVASHFRYPEFMFKMQTFMWGRYHQENPSTFFNNSDRWIVAPRPSDRGVGTEADDLTAGDGPLDPYYQEMLIGNAEGSEFVLTRPFVLSSGDGTGRNLTAIMVARNDPENYGRLEQVVMVNGEGDEAERNSNVDGPLQANRKMITYQPVAEYQTLVGRSGSRVRFGNILTLPIGDALVYVRPIYAAEESSNRFAVKKVVVGSGDAVGFGDTIELAMQDLLDGNPDDSVADPSLSDAPAPDPGDEVDPTTTTTTTTTLPDGETRTPTELLAEADRLFNEADARLAARDLGGYEDLIAQARTLVSQATAALGTTPVTVSPDN